MFAHAFVRNAYLAGTFIALASGVVGWFVVARAQLFAGDALSHVAFVGAIAAAVVGVDERVGLFAVTLAVAAGLAALGGRERQDDAAIGTVFAWILGIGVLLIALLATSEGGGAGVTTTNALFGSIYSLSTGASWLAAAIALAVTIAVTAMTRPLLLTTIDAEQAAARGVPVRLLGLGILLAVAAVTAEGTQAVGALLILGLLSAPAGAAHRLTANPYGGVAISSLIAVAATWGGLALSYEISSLPPSSAIIGLAAAAFAIASVLARTRR
jgi:zinc/manganese transport system permease protein